ncbi:MAG: hypothetical protein PVS3B1_00940 [Ktedonobacteraceae bacterium]
MDREEEREIVLACISRGRAAGDVAGMEKMQGVQGMFLRIRAFAFSLYTLQVDRRRWGGY